MQRSKTATSLGYLFESSDQKTQACYVLYLCLRKSQPLKAAEYLNEAFNRRSLEKIKSHRGRPGFIDSGKLEQMTSKLQALFQTTPA
jgi:hypothetical protein